MFCSLLIHLLYFVGTAQLLVTRKHVVASNEGDDVQLFNPAAGADANS